MIKPPLDQPIFTAMKILGVRDSDVAKPLGVSDVCIQHVRKNKRPYARQKWLVLIADEVARQLLEYERKHPDENFELAWSLIKAQRNINANFSEETKQDAKNYLNGRERHAA